jgi:hypothetical protein
MDMNRDEYCQITRFIERIRDKRFLCVECSFEHKDNSILIHSWIVEKFKHEPCVCNPFFLALDIADFLQQAPVIKKKYMFSMAYIVPIY